MLKHNKKGIWQVLLNPLVLSLLVVGSLILLFSSPNSPFKLAILSNFDFVGFTFQDIEEENKACGQAYSGFASNVEGGGLNPIVITANGGSIPKGKRFISTDITGIDEVIVIYEGWAKCNPRSTGANIYASVKGSENGEVRSSKSASCSSAQDFHTFQPAMWKFKNNFDGTWSYLESLGVGDVFIVRDKQQITGNVLLDMGVNIESSCGEGGSGSASLTLYNIVRKENTFAICKADEYLTTDATGKQICNSLSTIVLNSEEAIKESFDEKIARLTAELETKNTGLSADITALKQQLAQQQGNTELLNKVNALEQELQATKNILADVQTKDRAVINTIESQEQFERPNAFKEFLNKIIAWIKNLFK